MEVDSSQEQQQQRPLDFIHLIVFGKEVETCYYDRCEVRVKKHKIFVTPEAENAQQLKRTIDDNFVRFKKIICFFSNTNGFALLFDHKKHCKDVHRVLQEKKLDSGNFIDESPEKVMEHRFMVPMIRELYDYIERDFDLRISILKMLKSLDVEQKQRLAPSIIATKLPKCLLDSVLVGVDYSLPGKNSKKKSKSVNRRASTNSKTDEEDDDDETSYRTPVKKPRTSNRMKSIADLEPIKSDFEVIDYMKSGIHKTHLFIFPSDGDRTLCNEYNWEVKSGRFKCVCAGCQKVGPVIQQDSEGNDRIYFIYDRCKCKSRPFDPEKYKSDILIYPPGYKIVDVPFKQGSMRQLHIYASEDKKKCYKFTYNAKLDRYACGKCQSLKNYVRAVVCLDEDDEEHVALQDKKHKCNPVDC